MTSVKASKKYMVARYREGKCINCGQSRRDSPFLRLCEPCGETRKKHRRAVRGFKPWKLGGRGRPPLNPNGGIKIEIPPSFPDRRGWGYAARGKPSVAP